MFGETLISWCSKKEPVVTLSSCEADCIFVVCVLSRVVEKSVEGVEQRRG